MLIILQLALSFGILELAIVKDEVYYPSCFVDGHLLWTEELYDQRQVPEIADDLHPLV